MMSGLAVADGSQREAEDGPAGSKSAPSGRWDARSMVPRVLLAVAAISVLFTALLGQARTTPVTGDGSAQALQAWDMLHGNLLLHGWRMSDVSFYTTELPEYALVELVHGLNGDTTPIAAALSYTLVVVLSVVAAVGRTRGRQAWIRGGVVAAALIAPSRGLATGLLLSSPDHIGTAVPLLAIYIVIDRGGSRRWVPYVVGAMLTWAAISDQIVIAAGSLPVLLVAGWRAVRPGSDRRFEVRMGVAAALSVPLSVLVVKLIAKLGGFTVATPTHTFAELGDLSEHFSMTVKSVLALYSADFSNMAIGAAAAVAFFHLLAVAAAALGCRAAIRRFADPDDPDARLEQVLVMTVGCVLAAYMFSTLSNGHDAAWAREIAPVLPIGAVLGARYVGTRITEAAIPFPFRWAAAAMAGCVALSAGLLVAHATRPSRPADGADAAAYLQSHGLVNGLGGYWMSHSITAVTGDRVKVRPVSGNGQTMRILPGDWEAKPDWYRPDKSTATFMVVDIRPGYEGYGTVDEALATFGKAAQRLEFHDHVILVWDHNILNDFRR
ncbi:MAG: hypothetical protein HOV87_31015 [Catenulispora sp.]|nr:hypothetical protein [Catenulispora sp.]